MVSEAVANLQPNWCSTKIIWNQLSLCFDFTYHRMHLHLTFTSMHISQHVQLQLPSLLFVVAFGNRPRHPNVKPPFVQMCKCILTRSWECVCVCVPTYLHEFVVIFIICYLHNCCPLSLTLDCRFLLLLFLRNHPPPALHDWLVINFVFQFARLCCSLFFCFLIFLFESYCFCCHFRFAIVFMVHM